MRGEDISAIGFLNRIPQRKRERKRERYSHHYSRYVAYNNRGLLFENHFDLHRHFNTTVISRPRAYIVCSESFVGGFGTIMQRETDKRSNDHDFAKRFRLAIIMLPIIEYFLRYFDH